MLSQVYVQVRRGLPRLFTIVISGTCTSSEVFIETFYSCYLKYLYKFGGTYRHFLQLLIQVPVKVRRGLHLTIVTSGICPGTKWLIHFFYNCYDICTSTEGLIDFCFVWFLQLLFQISTQVQTGLPRLFKILISGTCTSMEGLTVTV